MRKTAISIDKTTMETFGLKPEDLAHVAVITIYGDGMEPTLTVGSVVVVDTRETDFSEGLYLIGGVDAPTVKRIAKDINGGREDVLVISDNPAYPTQKSSLRKIKIVGKVIGALKKF